MSNALKKTWPYALALLLLAGIAIITGDYLRFDLFGNNKTEVEEDSVSIPVDSLSVTGDLEVDSIQEDTSLPIAKDDAPVIDETIKQWRLVIASVPSQEDANRILDGLSSEGAEVKYVSYLDTYRVVYGSYPELSEAQGAFEAISNEHPKAWLVYF